MSDFVVRLTGATVEIPLRGIRPADGTADPRILRNRRGQWVLRALDNVNLEIRRGERIGIVGGNGAGKTTLLKLIAGMLPAASGHVEVNGSMRALLSIGAGLYPALSGRQNALIQYGLLGIRKISKADFLRDVEAFAELGDFFDMPVGAYSPGMTSRLQFAVNTVDPADILLLDEWMGVADQAFHARAQERLHKYVHSSEAFLFASHNSILVEQLTDKNITVHDGSVEPVEVARSAAA